MLLDAMRVGKTPQAIRACDLVGANTVLWVTKGRVRWDHAAQWRRFGHPGREIIILATGKDRPRRGAVNIVSYELASGPLLAALLDLVPDTAVFDEFHQFGNPGSRRTKAAYGPRIDGRGGLVQWPFRLWFLSGTPAPRDPTQIWPTLRCVFPETILSRKGHPLDLQGFTNRYCQTRYNGFGREVVGGKNLDALKAQMEPYFLRRRFEDVNAEIPKLRFADLPLDAGDYLKELRREELDAALAELGVDPDAGGDAVATAIEAAQDQVQRKIAKLTGLAKVKPLAALLRDELDEGLRKVVIFAWHRDVIEAYAAALADYEPVVMYGGSKQGGDVAFNTDDARRVFIGQIQAAGEGINLAAADDIVFAEAFWTPGLLQQAYYRCSAPTKTRPVLVRFALADVGVDGRIMRKMRERAEMMEALFG